ncbi:transcription-repair coupling factor [Desulfonema ishimotonii]|uniref:Transcription-repair-coupling factor n=1 Tax=Desulfonema ishimotonii TaxID=45657 RepID=A0A401G4J9_9BACT|nr:transcription-repair coupling factor [Desulfonema ishimotonii]GBC64121.1 transcription-repair coupling factor [Desulfonema ishimotonii]
MFTDQNQEKNSLRPLIARIPGRRRPIVCSGLQGAEKAYLVARLYAAHKMPVIVLTGTRKDADRFAEDLAFFSGLSGGPMPVQYFSHYNILPFRQMAYHNQTAAERLRVLYRFTDTDRPAITVMTPEALKQKVIPRSVLTDYAELIMAEEEIDRDALIRKLIAGGYARTAIVEEPGDFCVRGGILDIFSPLYSAPLRIEMFGDLVESVRFFSATTQRSMDHIPEAIILPAREAILKLGDADPFVHRVRALAAHSEIPARKVRAFIERIRKEGIFSGIESFTPLLYDGLETLFDYVPDNALFVLDSPEEIASVALESDDRIRDNYQMACAEEKLCIEPDGLYMRWPEAQAALGARNPLMLKMLQVSAGQDETMPCHIEVTDNALLRTALVENREAENPLLPLAGWIREKSGANLATLMAFDTRARAERIAELLTPYGIRARFAEGFPDPERARGMVCICQGSVSGGFVWPDESLALLTEAEIFGGKGRRRRKTAPKAGVRTELLAFEDLKQGELIVHTDQGVGRYEELVKLKLNGATGDFLLITYKDGDKLYLPVDRMRMIQKYMGVDGIEPILDKMGGSSWGRVREKVKKSVEKIAGELLRLYAERKVRTGQGFRLSERALQEFEAGFPYEETPDQLRAIEDVFSDMERETPMDRLVCGDVGYGKTEVALRAAFMAVSNARQVAVLVPTTVLAEQHLETFARRFANHGVRVACLSRFRSGAEQRGIIRDLAEGKVDIIIGTHRLLQKDIVFKAPGLIIVDEEHRFGVRHKEKLKKMRSTVDVLALTATPIPRTLHMSLTGIRDISVISTPPEQRRAIITYISEFEDGLVAEAIRRELKRGGQLYFVHNSIRSIDRIAGHLKRLVPELRLDTAHGRMDEEALEAVMLRFTSGEIDLLVCTTIIESGLDIPAANTIIVNRADRFGLSQIYQLRGRVGRGDEQAYAYLLIPDESALTRDARKRLKVLMEHSGLGAGFQIAMNDLKIRGGGSLLGASQSGHIAAVGYDMFLKLMEDAISHLKGEPVAEELDPEINIPVSAFISEDYIPDIDQRLTLYRRLSGMSTPGEITAFKAELADRFGPLPAEAASLLLKILLKILAVKAGVRRLDLNGEQLVLHFSEAHQKNPFGLVDMITADRKHYTLTPDHVLKARLSDRRRGGPLGQTKNILKEITQHVNG